MTNSKGTARRRRILFIQQDAKCFYCHREVIIEPTSDVKKREFVAVVEHYIPRHKGGKLKDCVLACTWCDKHKGMIPGPEFIELMADKMKDRDFVKAKTDIAQEAKARNVKLMNAHEPNLAGRRNGERLTPNRKLTAPQMGLGTRGPQLVKNYSYPKEFVPPKLGGVLGLPGNEGRDKFIQDWVEKTPAQIERDKFWESWTEKKK